jgi:hypothetical protein
VGQAFFFKLPAPNQSFSSEFSVLRCEVHHTAIPGSGKLGTRSRFWKKNQTAGSSPAPCTSSRTRRESSHTSQIPVRTARLLVEIRAAQRFCANTLPAKHCGDHS